jgi:hypothetical protein
LTVARPLPSTYDFTKDLYPLPAQLEAIMVRLILESAAIGAVLGILAAWLPTLFDFQLDPVITSAIAGIGVGIYAARRYPKLR